ncbi:MULTISPECIES: TetR/AcrR family transcriptional regulator [unclassified Mycolicibacterium]|uniref:TetR/AcrR family transcriptional regulator n=1 Tax=unclassified Mycolicibacterium TaxID=2636767 RepID=UPI0012DD03B3|nr:MULTISPECIES: TetR/AcrR family transcriptional regulator [unclassified Mycolicibacterium]MUL81664.1 TetR/AcrR family transcriptional regulator [Mycolicibacterium sp. CBMA 329]MUL87430.1 TetR/AcrR family transcriptional regulator [Mycolicibacterium sp. CBMA 331]MUL99704.1 TetR/AcrR family transcriptional regulator [Mycolicibacterium sp. CBMA 334]MUM28289.1 TetR/AcrR family transcriptional regulator [Mycolicibacterium sp. CBMA 295]MUM37727.1 TetR/AcrR family transcriptional regulator [Mycolic
MTEEPRRALRRDAERNRQRVIDAARELFAEKGLEATLNDVAHHANVGVGTVYRRFATKEELLDAVFEDGIDQIVGIAETALRKENSWDGFVWFVEQSSELTATDRGLREMVYSKAYGGHRVECSRLRLSPPVSKIVERARDDGYLRPDIEPTDMPILSLLAGTVSEWAGHVEPELWRRYVAILIDGMRYRSDQAPVPVGALDEEALDTAMRTWEPAGPPG